MKTILTFAATAALALGLATSASAQASRAQTHGVYSGRSVAVETYRGGDRNYQAFQGDGGNGGTREGGPVGGTTSF